VQVEVGVGVGVEVEVEVGVEAGVEGAGIDADTLHVSEVGFIRSLLVRGIAGIDLAGIHCAVLGGVRGSVA